MHHSLLRKLNTASLFLLLFSLSAFAGEVPGSVCDKTEKLLYLGNKLHYEVPPFDKTFCKRVVQSCLYSLDPQCLYFLNEDIKKLEEIQNRESKAETIFCQSYDLLLSVYKNRLMQADSILNADLTKKFT